MASEFCNYQLLCDEDITYNVLKEAKTNSGDIQIDYKWCFLSEMKNVDSSYRFEKLSKISKLILTVPHSNTEKKSIFSMARKNKTGFRPNMDPDETLVSLITVKLATENEPIHNQITARGA